MLTLNHFHKYQFKALNHSLIHPQSMEWLSFGLGKTPVTLASIDQRKKAGQIQSALVIAPLTVAQSVWDVEALKWDFSHNFTFSFIHGTQAQKVSAIEKHVDVYLINYAGLVWLADYLEREFHDMGRPLPFQMLVADEVSKLKNMQTIAHTALRKFLLSVPYRMGLTGSPASSGLVNLFGQYLAIDGGERLGISESAFKKEYFAKSGYMGYKISEKADTQQRIMEKISDITMEMQAKDYLELPPVTYNNVNIPLPPKLRKKYDEMEKQMFLELDSGDRIDVVNMAALTIKLLQFSDGSMYVEPENPQWEKIHDLKMDALDQIIENSNGKPVLCFYQFQHVRERILKKYKHAEFFKSNMGREKIQNIIHRWNNNEIPLLAAHCQSAGHGLNLQYANGSQIVWFGIPWSLENYVQANARIARQGVGHHVIIHRLLCVDTVDYAVAIALAEKANTEHDLRVAVGRYRKYKLGLN